MELMNEQERYASGVLSHDAIAPLVVLAIQQYSETDEPLPGL